MTNPRQRYPFGNTTIELRYRDPDAVLNCLLLAWIAVLASRELLTSQANVYPSQWLLTIGVPVFLAAALAMAPAARSATGRLMQRALVLATGLSTLSVDLQPLLISCVPWLLAGCVVLMKIHEHREASYERAHPKH